MAGCEQLVSKAEFDAFKQQVLKELQGKLGKEKEKEIVEAGGKEGYKLVEAGLGLGITAVVAKILTTKEEAIEAAVTKSVPKAVKESEKLIGYQKEIFEKRFKKLDSVMETIGGEVKEVVYTTKVLDTKTGKIVSEVEAIKISEELLQKEVKTSAVLGGQLKSKVQKIETDIDQDIKPKVEKVVGEVKIAGEAAGSAGKLASKADNLAGKSWKLAQDAWGEAGKLANKFAPLLALLGLVGFVLDIINLLTVWTLINAIEDHVDSLDKTITNLNQTITSLYSQIGGLKIENQGLKTQISVLGSQLKNAQQTAENAQDSANTAKSAADNAKSAANNAITEANTAISEVKQLEGKFKGEIGKLALLVELIVATSNSKIEALLSQIKILEQKIATLNLGDVVTKAILDAMIGGLKGQLENLKQALSVADYVAAQMGQKASQAYNLANQAYNLAETAIDIASSGNPGGANGDAIAGLQQQVSSLGGQLNSLSGQVSAAASKPSITPKDIYSDKFFIELIDGKIIQLANKDNIGNQTIDNLKAQVQEQNFKYEKLNGSVVNFQKQTDGSLKEIGQAYKDSITNQKQVDAQQNQQISTLAGQVTDAQNKVASLGDSTSGVTKADVQQTIDVNFKEVIEPKLQEITTQTQQSISEVNTQVDNKINTKVTSEVNTQIKTQVEPKIQESTKMNEQQFKDLTNDIKKQNDQVALVALTLAPLVPLLNNINNNTSNIPKSPCLAPQYVPPVGADVKKNIAATEALNAYTAAQTTKINATTTAIKTETAAINTNTSAIKTIAQQTLTKVGAVAKQVTRLYKFLGIDRFINWVNMALLLHNAMMLSRNLGETATSSVDAIFQLVGFKIKDDENNEISFSELVGKEFKEIMEKTLGKENVKSMSTTWKKASAIYSAAANLLSSVQQIWASGQALTAIAIENTGKIGNALRKAGAVIQDAYGHLPDNVNANTKFQQQMQKVTGVVDGAENIFSGLDNVTGELQSTKDAKEQIFGKTNDDGTKEKGQVQQMQEAVNNFNKEENDKEKANNTASQSPAIAKTDMVKPE